MALGGRPGRRACTCPRHSQYTPLAFSIIPFQHTERPQESDAAANQRYLIAEGRFSPQYFVNWMRRQHPRLARSKGLRRGNPSELFPEEGTYTANNSKSKQDLGLTYRSVETMLTDTFDRYAQLATDRAIA